MILADRVSTLKPSLTLALTAEATRLKATGRKIISFGAGEPDFDTPDYIKHACKQAIDAGKTRYTPVSGVPDLKASICQYFKTYRHLTYSPDSVVVSCGAKHSLANAFLAIINPGDQVIIPAPYWVSYPDQVRLAGGDPCVVKTDHTFKLTPDRLERAITSKTKAIIINSPSNPTGAIYTADELAQLAPLIEKHQLYVISDEIYSQLCYDQTPCVSPATLSDYLYDHTIVIDGVSKSYAMTGFRIGFLGANPAISKAMTTIQSQMTSNPNTPAQYASIAALSQPIHPDHVALFQNRRDQLVSGLNTLPSITCNTPPGAFYAFASIKSVLDNPSTPGGPIANALEFCDRLLKEHDVMCIPGDAFGDPTSIRLSYAVDSETIKTGLSRLHTFLGSIL